MKCHHVYGMIKSQKSVIAVIVMLIPAIVLAVRDPHEKSYGARRPITVLQGATMCANHGDIVFWLRPAKG